MTESSIFPDVDCVLVCEDIRKEVTGKDIIIGVLGDDITTSQFPLGLRVSLYLRLRFREEGSFPFEVRVVNQAGAPLTRVAKANIISKSISRVTVAIILGITFIVVNAGEVRFQWRQEGTENWRDLTKLFVRQGDIKLGSNISFTPMTTV